MTAKIINFPEIKKTIGYKIPLYTDEEIFITVAAMNIFCKFSYKINENNLPNHDPVMVIEALTLAKNSDIISSISKKTINGILKSIESIELRG